MVLINFYCHFRASRELHSDQGQNFESQLLLEFSWSLKICKIHITPLQTQSDDMVDWQMKMCGTNWGRSFWHTIQTGMRAYSSSCWPTQREQGVQKGAMPDLQPIFLVLPTRNIPQQTWQTSWNSCDIHHYACQYLKKASNRMKVCYVCLANSGGFQQGDQVWLYCPTWTRGK